MRAKFDVGDSARPGEDLGRHGDLANVVDVGRQSDATAFLGVHAEPVCNGRGELGDAPLVSGRERVTDLCGRSDRPDG